MSTSTSNRKLRLDLRLHGRQPRLQRGTLQRGVFVLRLRHHLLGAPMAADHFDHRHHQARRHQHRQEVGDAAREGPRRGHALGCGRRPPGPRASPGHRAGGHTMATTAAVVSTAATIRQGRRGCSASLRSAGSQANISSIAHTTGRPVSVTSRAGRCRRRSPSASDSAFIPPITPPNQQEPADPRASAPDRQLRTWPTASRRRSSGAACGGRWAARCGFRWAERCGFRWAERCRWGRTACSRDCGIGLGPAERAHGLASARGASHPASAAGGRSHCSGRRTRATTPLGWAAQSSRLPWSPNRAERRDRVFARPTPLPLVATKPWPLSATSISSRPSSRRRAERAMRPPEAAVPGRA